MQRQKHQHAMHPMQQHHTTTTTTTSISMISNFAKLAIVLTHYQEWRRICIRRTQICAFMSGIERCSLKPGALSRDAKRPFFQAYGQQCHA
eukprot:83646-Pelagomonas_calceolata.AAC.1